MSTILKNLKFTELPDRRRDPVVARREAIVARLTEQKLLMNDPKAVIVEKRWRGRGEAREQVEHTRKIRPWFREAADGSATMSIFVAGKPIEFAKGKSAVAVRSRDELPALADALIEAVRNGELDEAIEAARASRKMPTPRKEKPAARRAA